MGSYLFIYLLAVMDRRTVVHAWPYYIHAMHVILSFSYCQQCDISRSLPHPVACFHTHQSDARNCSTIAWRFPCTRGLGACNTVSQIAAFIWQSPRSANVFSRSFCQRKLQICRGNKIRSWAKLHYCHSMTFFLPSQCLTPLKGNFLFLTLNLLIGIALFSVVTKSLSFFSIRLLCKQIQIIIIMENHVLKIWELWNIIDYWCLILYHFWL